MKYLIRVEDGEAISNKIPIKNVLDTLNLENDNNHQLLLEEGYRFVVLNEEPTNNDMTKEAVEYFLPSDDGGNSYIQHWVIEDKPDLSEEERNNLIIESNNIALQEKLNSLKAAYSHAKTIASIDTGLGFKVNARSTDIENLKSGKAAGLLSIRDYDNQSQTITLEDYDTIISAIQNKIVSDLQAKWAKEDALNAIDLTQYESLDEINNFEVDLILEN